MPNVISYHPTRRPENYKNSYFTAGFKHFEPENIHVLAKWLCGIAWAPAVFQNGYRKKANFLYADFIALDFDNGELSLADAVQNVFCDMTHIIGTTKSHRVTKNGVSCDRYRIILKLKERISSLKDYEYSLKQYAKPYLDYIDYGCLEAARYYQPCKEIVSIEADGYLVDCKKAPENYGKFNNRKTEVYGKALVIPPKARQILRTKLYNVGNRNSELFRCACLMLRAGFDGQDVEDLIHSSKCTNLEPQEISKVIANATKTVMKG